jgi:hypothetical protein
MRKRIFALFAALLVVSSGAAAPVAAQGGLTGECSSLTSFIQNAVVLGLTGTQTQDCSPTNTLIEQMKESDGEQEKIDIYQSVTSAKATHEAASAQMANSINDSESVAWMKMQVAVAEAYQNGSSKATARIKAKEAIKDYYAVKEENTVRKAEAHMVEIAYLASVAENESAINQEYIYTIAHHPDGSEYNGESYVVGTVNQTYTLQNGEEVDYKGLEIQFTTENTVQGTEAYSLNNPDPSHYTGNENLNIDPYLTVKSAGGDYPSKRAYNNHWYLDHLDKMEASSQDLRAESEKFVNATYDDFAAGEANASDVISANTAMFEYGTEHSDNSSLYDSTAALTMMGFDTPNMSSSGTMDVAHQGNTYTGILLARNAPGGSWETGATYNTSNITGPVFVATTDGQKIDFENNTEFTIEQMRNRDGENTTSVDTTQYVYKTANTSELNAMQSDLIDLRQEIESREPDGGGGGSGSGLNSTTMIGIAALAGAALLLGGRDE